LPAAADGGREYQGQYLEARLTLMSAVRSNEWEWSRRAAECRLLPLTARLQVVEPQAPPRVEEDGQAASVEPLAPSGFIYII
jgi:hypothetical protein